MQLAATCALLGLGELVDGIYHNPDPTYRLWLRALIRKVNREQKRLRGGG